MTITPAYLRETDEVDLKRRCNVARRSTKNASAPLTAIVAAQEWLDCHREIKRRERLAKRNGDD